MNEQNNTQSSPQTSAQPSVDLLKVKIAKLNAKQRSNGKALLASIVGILIGFGLCIGTQTQAAGIIVLLVASLVFVLSITDFLSTLFQLSYFEKQLKAGKQFKDLSTSSRVANTLASLVLGIVIFFLVGLGLCFSIVAISSY